MWLKYSFNMTFIVIESVYLELLLYENILTVVICFLLGKRNHNSKDTILYSLFYSLQMVTGMKGLQIMNISMFMTLRRTLILFVFVLQKKWKLSNFFSVMFITSGAIIAGQEHLEDNYTGYLLILTNNMLNALALHKSKSLNIDPLELLFQNSCNQIPFLFIGAYFEFQEFLYLPTKSDSFFIALTLVSLMGFLLCYSTNLCNIHNSPIAIAITHNVKDIVITSYSFFFLKEEYDFQILAGIMISYLGSILYSIQKIKEIQTQYLPIPRVKVFQPLLIFWIQCKYDIDNILAKFSQPKTSYRNQNSLAIVKCVKESGSSNIFLEKLRAIDTNGVKGEIFLKEFCQINNLVNFKGQIHSEKLASFLDLKIIFLPSGQYYGEGRRQMYMLEHQREIYFLLPLARTEIQEVSSRILRSCFKCGKTTRDYFTPPCQHHICMPCIVRLALPSTGNYRCNYPACKQIVLYRTLLQFQEEQNCKKELEERKQNDIAVSQPPITIKSEQSFSEPKDSMVWVRCQKCSAEINYKPFTVQGCGHRFCLQCIPEKGTQCPFDGCQNSFYKSHFLDHQKQLQNKSQVQMSKCFQCLLSKSIKEQFVNDCGHTICNTCINKNIYVPRDCYQCYKSLNNKEYQVYKDRMLVQCDGCKEEYQTQNLYKNLFCDHLVCFKCINKGMRKDKVYCVAGCSKLLFGEQFLQFFEQQQNKQLELSVLELKEQEIKKQKEADELKKQKEIDEKNKQLDEYNEQKQNTDIDEQKQEKIINEQKKNEKKSFREESFSAHTKSNADQVADSLKHSKLIKVHSVQDYSITKIEQQPSSTKQLSVIKESEINQPEPKSQPSQLAVQQQSDLENSSQVQEILFQNLLHEGECTMCFTQFSQFNLRQPLECKEHQIGVCCIRNFKVCPQCERKGAISSIRVKEKLVLQKIMIQEEYQDSPKINKYSENNYFEKSAIYQPKTEKYNQYKDLLPQPSYQIDRYPPPSYERPVQRFTSTVGQQRFQSMDPRYSRYPVTTYQQSRQQIGLPF